MDIRDKYYILQDLKEDLENVAYHNEDSELRDYILEIYETIENIEKEIQELEPEVKKIEDEDYKERENEYWEEQLGGLY